GLLESDVESTTSSPHGPKWSRARQSSDAMEVDEEGGVPSEAEKASVPPLQRHISAEVVPMGPPPPPKPKQSKDCTFMEKLHAVDEELASSPVCMDSYQPLEDSLIAFRTRSKRPLKDVPLGQLEAELRAPDITPDMYDPNTADDEEWKRWLGGLMNDDVGNDDEADDDDDPEYNFLEDLDEPDTEDFRNDRAVRITMMSDVALCLPPSRMVLLRIVPVLCLAEKEVNELMEELFETFQDEMGFSNVEDEGPEDEDSTAEARPTFNTPQVLSLFWNGRSWQEREEPNSGLPHVTLPASLLVNPACVVAAVGVRVSSPVSVRFEEPLANLLNEQHRTVKEQLEQLRMKKAVAKPPLEAEPSKPPPCKKPPVLTLDARQRKKLQHQMQQHVQLLTQVHLLCSSIPSLSSEASTTQLFLTELNTFAQSAALLHHPLNPKAQTSFQPCNLKEALQLVEDFHAYVTVEWSPRKVVKKNAQDIQCLPKQVAWILATRQVFMYPQLLPICALRAKIPRDKIIFTKGEDNLLALGLKHFEGTEFPKPLISKYLLTTKTTQQLMVHIKNLTMNRSPENAVKYYKKMKQLPVLSPLCEEIQPGDRKPPIEREEHLLPSWLKDSLPYLQEALEQRAGDASPDGPKLSQPAKESAEWTSEGKYSLHAPKGLELILRPLPSHFYKKSWRRQRPATAKALPARSGSCPKVTPRQPQPEAPPSKIAIRVPRWIQPAPVVQPLPRVQQVSLQPAVANRGGFELRGLLPAQHSGPRPCLAAAVPQNLISPMPVAFQPKMMLPVLPVSKIWKPSSPRKYQKKRGPKSAPMLPSAPVVFTVPAAAVKAVSIANGCNVLQPLASAAGGPAQPIPITTLLVNPAPFSCPLSQPLVTSPSPSLVVPADSPGFPAPAKGTEFVSLAAGGGERGCPVPEPQTEPREPSLRATTPSEEDHGPQTSEPEGGGKTAASVQACVETAKEKVSELPAEGHFSPLAEVAEGMEAEAEGFCSAPPEVAPVPAETSPAVAPAEEELVLGLGQELDVDPTPEGANEQKEAKDERSSAETGQQPGGTAAAAEGGSPKNVSSVAAAEAESRSPSVKPEDPPSADGQAVGAVASREATGEKDGPEDEEEEDFDDLTQDEEDEEMSSASEESVLSVPELQ
ncbi:UNVERIFIED_CONTAM: hypothetical protein K2H54_016443, partial [Gekko kuhli]